MEFSRLHPGSSSPPQLNSHIMESLFFSMSVYEPTQDAVLQDLHRRFGEVEPLIYYGFEQDEDNKQAIFVARSPTGRIIVACRGTAGFRDIVADLKYLQSRLSFVKGAAAHWGFAERAESVPIDLFCKLLGAGEELIFTGHSLGGAVASLLSLRVLESSKGLYDEQVHCITFGCPLFASCRLAELINCNYKDVFTHIVSRRDVVPKILPFVSTLQKLVYADEDHLEGLFVLKNALSLLPGVPLGALISGIESRVPSLLKFLFRGFMKLAFPSGMTGSYAFAGHIVMLDTEGPLDRSFVLASADDMNVWHSQLGFAFGAGFDVTMIEEHMLECYHNGILRSLSHVRVRRDISFGDPPVKSAKLDSSAHNMIDLKSDCTDTSGMAHSQGLDSKGFDLDGKPQQQQQQSLVVRFTAPEGAAMDCQIQFCRDSSDGESSSSIVVTQSARQQEGIDCSGCSPRPWGTEGGGRSCNPSFTRTMSAGDHMFARSLGRSKSWRLERSMSSGWSPRSELGESNVLMKSTKELIIIRCRACAHLRMHMNITTCCHKAPRKGLGFGWLLGTIGRLSRHLRILDNLCYLTFVRIVVGNLVG